MDKYTIYEVAEILKTSHTTIYNKLNNKDICKEMRNFIIKQGKLRYISVEGIEVLRKYVPSKETITHTEPQWIDENISTIPETIDNKQEETYQETLQEINNKLIAEFKERIESLENQLSVKDKQIEALLRQGENSQVLLRQQQDKIFLLENTEPKDKPTIWSLFKRH